MNLRLVRQFERGGGTLYELAHDHMAAEIATWSDEAEMEAKLGRELLRREVGSWRGLGKLIEPGSLALIHERRDDLHWLDAAGWGCFSAPRWRRAMKWSTGSSRPARAA